MKLYLDDNCAGRNLCQQLEKAGHSVQIPHDVGLGGKHDAVHFRHAIKDKRLLLTRNYSDFQELHELVLEAQGHHPGILVIREDDNPKHNMKVSDIVRALVNLEAAGIPLADEYVNLNHWR